MVAKRHASEMLLKIKGCNSDKLSMLKEHEEKTKEMNTMIQEPEVKEKRLRLLYFKCNLLLFIPNILPLFFLIGIECIRFEGVYKGYDAMSLLQKVK